MKKIKIKLLTSIASSEWSYAFGEVVDVEEKLGKAWVSSGIAEEVKSRRTKQTSDEE